MRTVIKIGTSTLTYATGQLNIRRVESLVKVIADLKNAGNEIILVSSGAIAMGVGKLGLRERPHDMPTKQAAASVGQCELMYVYDNLFSSYGHTVAQLLITGSDLRDAERYENFRNVMNRLTEFSVIPVINENDTISTDEIAVGDNDTLGAIVAAAVEADLLILLSDIDGLYTADPHRDPGATLISDVYDLSSEILALAGGSGSALGTGGMRTKLHAAGICLDAGCEMVIANGADPQILYRIMNGENAGTRFHCAKKNGGILS